MNIFLITIFYSFKPGFFLYSPPNTTVLTGFQPVLRGERANFQHFLILSTGVPWLLWQLSELLMHNPPPQSLANSVLLLVRALALMPTFTYQTVTSQLLQLKTSAAA